MSLDFIDEVRHSPPRMRMVMGFPTIRVLFVTTEPEDLARPDTTEELERLQAALRGGRASFHVDNVYHATRASLMDALGRHRPEIVHFLGHGGLEGAFVETREGGKTLVTAEWLTAVFQLCPEVRLVVLNACTSAVSLARPLVDSKRTKIRGCLGWSDRVLEDDARSFAVDLFRRIAVGDSVHAAFTYAIHSSSKGFAEKAQPVLALRSGADFRPGRWRAVHFAALGGVVALLGLVGLGVLSLCEPGEPPVPIGALVPLDPKSDLVLFPPEEDRRPRVGVHLEAKALEVLKRRPEPAPTPRPTPRTPSDLTAPDSTRAGAALTPEVSVARDPPVTAPIHEVSGPRDPPVTASRSQARRSNDPTSARTIEDRVTARLTKAIPLLLFTAIAGDRAPTAGLTLQLRAEAAVDGGRWPNSPVDLEARLMLDGVALTQPWRLCTFTPGQSSDGLPLEQRFAACEEAIAERIERWDDHIGALVGAVPFETKTHYDPATNYISTQLVHANIAATYDAQVVFALRHPRIGALPFRACADERIGGYFTTEPERFEDCHKLYDAAQTQVRAPETRADRIYLMIWRGGQ